MTVRAYFSVDEEAIEDPEPLRQRVMVWRNAARKEEKRGITIGLR